MKLKDINHASVCKNSHVKRKGDTIIVMCVAALVIVLLALSLTFYFARGKVRGSKGSTARVHQKNTAYISHCATTKQQKQKLLQFSVWLESQLPGLSVIVDLTKETEINKVGGLSQWIPQQITKVDKVIVILSQEYIDALNLSINDVKCSDITSQTLKVISEYRYIELMLHNNYHVSNKLIVCWQSAHPGQLPPVFQGRSYYLLPKITKKGVLRDNAFLNILSAITGSTPQP